MTIWRKINNLIFPGTKGMVALSHFLISAVSGIFLAIPFDVSDAGNSVVNIILFSPQTSFIRNIHYWSSQLFLIFTILHIYSHFVKKTEKKLRFQVWLRLSLSLFFVFYIMLSGFIVKGDTDGLQAQRILSGLLSSIPLFGNEISVFFTGREGSLNVIYLHHIATAGLVLLLVIYEHSGSIFSKAETFTSSLIMVILLSLLLTAPFHDGNNPVLKGPWYFVGLQEILHSLKKPFYAVIIIVFLLFIIVILPKLKNKLSIFTKKLLFAFGIIFIALTITGFYFRGENWSLIFPWQKNYHHMIYFPSFSFINPFEKPTQVNKLTDKKESCLICHNKMTGFSDSHQPQHIGCSSCHLGQPFLKGKNQAHKKMIKYPGNLENAKLTCGNTNCHPDISSRINNNIMTTNSGIISVDRFSFNEQSNPSVLSHISSLKNSKADIHLKNLCTQCHLGKVKDYYGPLSQMQTGGGCLACHLNYSAKNETELKSYYGKSSIKKGHLTHQHPSLNLKKGNEACFACHSRSGRISLSYEGWYESMHSENEVKNNQNYRILDDKRALYYIEADIHHQAGMMCIDCHNSYELMGDNKKHIHKEDQTQIQCSDCHQNPPYKIIKTSEIDKESAIIISLRGIKQKHFLKTSKSGIPIINTYIVNDTAYLTGKTNGKKYILKPPADACKNNAHENLTCEMCHTPRVSACIGCHNSFDKNIKGTNYLNGKKTKGKWTEYAGEFIVAAPTAGVSHINGNRKISPTMPGMVMTVKDENSKDSFFKRLYAPANPHNTIKPKANCKNCHNNPQTIGYGKGLLSFRINNSKVEIGFQPYYENNINDRLPADAWIGFLAPSKAPNSTRNYLQPMNIAEQKRMLLVSSCLFCHDENSKVMISSLINFDIQLKRRTGKCYPPSYYSRKN